MWFVEAVDWQMVIGPDDVGVRLSWIETGETQEQHNEHQNDLDGAYAVAKGLVVAGKVAARNE